MSQMRKFCARMSVYIYAGSFHDLPEKRGRVFQKKVEIDELPDHRTDLFQRNTLDHYLDHPSKSFKSGQYQIIDQLRFADLIIIIQLTKAFREYWNWLSSSCVKWRNHRNKSWWTRFPKTVLLMSM